MLRCPTTGCIAALPGQQAPPSAPRQYSPHFHGDPEWQNRNDCSKHRRLQAMAHERICKRSVRRQRARQYLENRFYRNIPGRPRA
jgi:hypothetical protein